MEGSTELYPGLLEMLGRDPGRWFRAWIQIPALPLTAGVIVGKLLNLSVL